MFVIQVSTYGEAFSKDDLVHERLDHLEIEFQPRTNLVIDTGVIDHQFGKKPAQHPTPGVGSSSREMFNRYLGSWKEINNEMPGSKRRSPTSKEIPSKWLKKKQNA